MFQLLPFGLLRLHFDQSTWVEEANNCKVTELGVTLSLLCCIITSDSSYSSMSLNVVAGQGPLCQYRGALRPPWLRQVPWLRESLTTKARCTPNKLSKSQIGCATRTPFPGHSCTLMKQPFKRGSTRPPRPWTTQCPWTLSLRPTGYPIPSRVSDAGRCFIYSM